MLRLVLIGLVSLVAAALLLPVAIVLALQMEAGQRLLATVIEESIAPGLQIEEIDGFVPFDMRVGRVAVADAEGPWLEVEALQLRWDPWALLGARAHVHRLTAERLHLHRLPPAAEEEEAATEAEPITFDLPSLPVAVIVDAAAVAEIILERPVVGAAMRLAAEATVDIGLADRATAEVVIRRTDGEEGTARLSLAYRPGTDVLALDTEVAEAEGGLVARLLDMPNLPAVAFALVGEGPASDWNGRLTAEAAGMAEIEGDIALAAGDDYALRLDSTVRILRPLEGALAPLSNTALDVATALAWTPDARLTIDDLRIATEWAEIAANGALDTVRNEVDVAIAAEIETLSRLSDLAGIPLDGGARLEAEIVGSLLQPRLTTTLGISDLAVDTVRAAAAEARVDIDVLRPLTGPEAAAGFSARGAFEGVTVAGEPLPGPLSEDIVWSVAGEGDLAGAVDVADLAIAAGTAAIVGTAAVDPAAQRASADITLAVADLRAFRDLTGTALSGRAGLDIRIAADLATGALEGALDGSLEEVAVGIAAADALLARRATLEGTFAVAADGSASVSDIRIETPALTLAANGTAAPDFAAIEAAIDGRIPRLNVLADALGTPMSGALSVSVSASGAPDDLRAEADVRGTQMAIAGVDLGGMTADLSVANLPGQPTGRIAAEAAPGGVALRLASRYALSPNSVLTLDDLSVRALDSTIAGSITANLERTLVDGDLVARIPDAAALGTVLGVDMAGSGEAEVNLATEDGRQTVVLDLRGRDLGWREGEASVTLDSLTVEASLRDVFGRASGRALADAETLRSDAATVDRINLAVQGDEGAFSFSGIADGTIEKPFSVAVGGDAALTEAGQEVTLTALDVAYADASATLAGPATIQRAGDRLVIRDFALAVGDGRISANLDVVDEAVAGRLDIDRFPFAALSGLRQDLALEGTLDAEITLDGRMTAPVVTLDADARGLVARDTGAAPVPPVDIDANARWQDGRVSAAAEVTGIEGTALSAEASLAVVAAPDLLSPEVVSDAPLSGRLSADADLDALRDLLPLGGERLGGRFSARLAAGGTAADPEVSGTATLSEGFFESAVAGTVLNDIEARFVGDGDQLVLQSFTANDGGNGTVRAEGEVAFAPDLGFPFTFAITAESARLLRRDEIDAEIEAALDLRGDSGGATAGGTITIRSAEVRIPNKLPANVATVDYVEINVPEGRRRARRPQEDSAPAAAPFPVTLDIVVAVPSRLIVRGKGLESDWSGRLNITGTAAAPQIVGSLGVDRGRVSLVGQTFAITRGVITFDGGREIDPALDVVGEADADGLVVRVVVSGRASRPSIDLESEPPLPSDEILARLLFGTDTTQLTAVQALQLAQTAAALTGGAGGFNPIDTIRETLRLDRLDVQTEGEDIAATTLTAGKYIGSGIFLALDQGITEDSSKVTVEVELTPNLSLESEIGANATGNIGVNWEWDY